MKDNQKIFQKIDAIVDKYPLVFVSSNSGTGKTTHEKWMHIRRAVKGKERVDFFFRFENNLDENFNASKFLSTPKNASKRLLKLASKVDIIKESGATGNDYFLIKKENGEKIGQGLCVNTQKKWKSTENPIFSNFALFDEIMPDDNIYCQDEVYKFSRLIDTRARNRKYSVLGLYNKTQPYFPYEESFKKAGAKFIDFVGKKFDMPVLDGIQKVLSLSNYGEVYTNNNYKFYEEFYKDVSAKFLETNFYIFIQNRLFAVKGCEDYFVIIPKNKVKKNKMVFSLSMENNQYELLSSYPQIEDFLKTCLEKRLLFCNRKKQTIFVKTLADFLYLDYNI